MIKKIGLILSFTLLSSGLFANELELGLSMTPGSLLYKTEATASRYAADESLLGFHVGYSFWWLFYASWDSMIVPPWFIEQQTQVYDAAGFMNFYDVGIRPKIGPLYLLATIGVTDLYVHNYYATEQNYESNEVGANIRLGVGFVFDVFSVNIVGTSFYKDFAVMQKTLQALAEGKDPNAQEDFLKTLLPSVGFVLHL